MVYQWIQSLWLIIGLFCVFNEHLYGVTAVQRIVPHICMHYAKKEPARSTTYTTPYFILCEYYDTDDDCDDEIIKLYLVLGCTAAGKED